jgi:uncharacterized protein YbaP (TraB family)
MERFLMRRLWRSIFVCCICLAAAQVAAQDFSSEAAPLDEVVVSGVRSGPRMWKVANGEHELWILGVLDPLPQKMQWQSQEVSDVLAQSQAVLLDNMSVSADAGFFAKVGLYLQWRRMQKNPDHKTLRDVLPADLYARFSSLRQRYAKSSDLDDYRPIVASARLYEAAVAQMGLSSHRAVATTVEKLAKQHHIKPQTARIKVTQPRELLDSLARISTEAEIGCMAATLTHLESDVDMLRQRANAWALGDINTLRNLLISENRSACWAVLSSVPRVEQLTRQAEQEWLAIAEQSLQHNRSTLALRAIRDLLTPDGVLAQFRLRGYQISGP